MSDNNLATRMAIVDSSDSVVGRCTTLIAAYRRIARATEWPTNEDTLSWEEVRAWLDTNEDITVVIGLDDFTRQPIEETYRIVEWKDVEDVAPHPRHDRPY